MMVFFDERLAYLAVPKTGGTALENALGGRASAIFRNPPGIRHALARDYERRYRKLFDRSHLKPVETCAVIREPIDWLGSWFRYRQRPSLEGHPNSTAGMSFDDFIAAYLQDERPTFADVGSQTQFIADKNGDLLVHHLFQYEQLDRFYSFLQTRLSHEFRTKPANVSPKGNVALSAKNEAALREKHPIDFQLHTALNDGPLSAT